jgi:hypothetical protein
MVWAQLGQRGGVGAEMLVHSSHINENSVLEPPPNVAQLQNRQGDQQHGVQ